MKVPYNSNIQRTVDQIKHFIRSTDDPQLMAEFDEIADKVISANLFNPEAVCRISYIEEEAINISEMCYPEEYEILTGMYQYTDESGELHEFESKAEFIEGVKNILIDERYQEALDDEEYFVHEEDGNFVIYDEDPADEDVEMLAQFTQEEVAKHYVLNEINSCWEEDAESDAEEALEQADFEPDEVYWNWAWKYGGDNSVDLDAAIKCNLVVIRITDHNHPNYDEEFVTLGGCGMDLSPTLISYKALMFNAITNDDAIKLVRQPTYFRQVAHQAWPDVIKRLGLDHVYDEHGNLINQ